MNNRFDEAAEGPLFLPPGEMPQLWLLRLVCFHASVLVKSLMEKLDRESRHKRFSARGMTAWRLVLKWGDCNWSFKIPSLIHSKMIRLERCERAREGLASAAMSLIEATMIAYQRDPGTMRR